MQRLVGQVVHGFQLCIDRALGDFAQVFGVCQHNLLLEFDQTSGFGAPQQNEF